MDIAVVGSNNVDLITYVERMPKLGETLEAPDFEMGCGGKGANQAVAASRLGAKVRMVTRVGTDIFAANTVKNFADNGIDTEWVLETEGPSGSPSRRSVSSKPPESAGQKSVGRSQTWPFLDFLI